MSLIQLFFLSKAETRPLNHPRIRKLLALMALSMVCGLRGLDHWEPLT